ncbi:hypothetical protein KHC23_07610 [Ancylobacter dichloromethanicus]|nr:hypothetical protein [Ancylobacter dichloromethanicus]MBS7553512.1 hypothetical protein [Ancylobacter dichloromethanicus]
MSAPLTMTLADLAAAFRRTVPTTSRHLRRLEDEQGFPPALPGRKPKLWSRAQVEAWLRDPRHAPAGPSPAANDSALDPAFSPDAIAAASARLAGRYGASHV